MSRAPSALLPRSRAPRRGAVALALLAIALEPLACATNPVTGEREVILMSTDQEKKIDREQARMVEAELGLVDDPVLVAYVNELGQAMASKSPRKDIHYVFNVIAMDEPNAFALPGGHIYVSRGLLALTNSEAELANVLGHEIGHVAARHTAQRDALLKIMSVMNVVGMIGATVGGATHNGNPGPVGQPGIFGFNREQESEADRIGMDLAVATGIDPMGMANLLDALEGEERLQAGFARQTSYFDTHPAARERAADAATAAQLRRWKSKFAIAETREAYLERLEGLSIGTPAAEGVVKANRFMHADLGIALRFPQGWKVENTNSAVIGLSPGREAVVLLELAGEGDDPQAAAMAFAERGQVHFGSAQSVEIAGLDAFRAEGEAPTPAGRKQADLTWIAHAGKIYRLTGFALQGRYAAYQGVLRGFPRGFRSLTDAERDEIDEVRLRVVEAQEGETLSELARRTGNTWQLTRTSVANKLPPDVVLAAGQRVKIAVREPYRGKTERPQSEPEPFSPEAAEPQTPPDASDQGAMATNLR